MNFLGKIKGENQKKAYDLNIQQDMLSNAIYKLIYEMDNELKVDYLESIITILLSERKQLLDMEAFDKTTSYDKGTIALNILKNNSILLKDCTNKYNNKNQEQKIKIKKG